MQATEKKLLQTVDMILVKKKRIALAKRDSKLKSSQVEGSRTGWWGVLKTVTSVGRSSSESILLIDAYFRSLAYENDSLLNLRQIYGS